MAEFEDFLRCGRFTGFQHHEHLDLLAAFRVGDADGRGLGDFGVFEKDLFDVARVDVVAAGNDHVLFAVHDEKIALRVHHGDIAGVQPAVDDGLGRGILALPVAPHDLGAAHHEFAGLAHRHFPGGIVEIDDARFGVGNRYADAADLALAAVWVDVGDGGGFGHPEPLDDDRTGLGFEITDDLDGQRRTSGKAALDAGQVGLVDFGMPQHTDVHRRHQRCERRAKLADGLQQRLGLRFGNENVAPPHEDGKIHGHRKAEDVKEGQRPEHDLFAPVEFGKPGPHVLNLPAEVAVGQHHPLGHPGGAAGVLQHGNVVEIQFYGGRWRRVLGQHGFPFVQIGGWGHIGGEPLFFAHEREQQVLGKGQVVPDGGVDDGLDRGSGPQRHHAFDQQIERDQ